MIIPPRETFKVARTDQVSRSIFFPQPVIKSSYDEGTQIEAAQIGVLGDDGDVDDDDDDDDDDDGDVDDDDDDDDDNVDD